MVVLLLYCVVVVVVLWLWLWCGCVFDVAVVVLLKKEAGMIQSWIGSSRNINTNPTWLQQNLSFRVRATFTRLP